MSDLKRPGSPLELIFWFVSHGFSVIPCHLGSKVPKIRWGKYQKQLPTESELLRWFHVPSNAAVVAGTNNLVVIDFDDITEYVRWSLWVGTDGSPAAKQVMLGSYKVRTSRGLHLYTRCTGDIRNYNFGKIDIKGRGGLVTLPGSLHPSGHVYTEYQAGDFPLWHELTELFPKETLEKMEKVAAVRTRPVDLEILNYTPEQVLDMNVGIADLSEIKKRHRIEDFLAEITYTGDQWGLTKCPFHEDENPSFWVDTGRQLCGCFSGCTARPLDVVNLYARLNNISNSDAIHELGAR